ncbi:PIG-L deacetylase family protein [Sinorhizobium fredii]|uniref:PIG-L deacetylase family protein n=1 Tax=Rhizobium fredii TaxID=380 RepID=UPI0012964B07|nr:PIG-L family deacetylase [Sinorhizobium fredii]MQW94012.1 hypothetical protein [Sinorhizobium fredii]
MDGTTARVLVLAPHADDAEFGLGAAFLRWQAEYEPWVRVVIAACGDYVRSDGRPVQATERLAESARALSYLGVREIENAHWFAENQGFSCDYAGMVTGIEKQLETFRPDMVFTCLPSFNQDHKVLFDATITAFRNGYPDLYAYEYPGNAWGPPPPEFGRKYLPADERHVEAKIKALAMHKSQFDGRAAVVDPEAARTLARQRGAEIGVPFAELCYVVREIG